MSNFDPLDGYPFGVKAPLSHDAVNQASEQMQKTVNATDGSSHAPTDVIAWSGAAGGGFEFDTSDPFLFYGKLDVTTGLTCTAPIAGSVTFTSLVAVTIANATFSSVATYNTGTTTTFNGTAVCTFGSSTTVNLSGAVNVRGTTIFKSTAGGGPAVTTFQTGTTTTFDSGSTLHCNGSIAVGAGVTITGSSFSITGGDLAIDSDLTVNGAAVFQDAVTFNDPVTTTDDVNLGGDTTLTGGTDLKLSPARDWERAADGIAATAYPGGVALAVADLIASVPLYRMVAGISTANIKAILHIATPPDGSTITEVVVTSKGSVSTTVTVGNFRVIRWKNTVTVAPENLSNAVNDAHDGTGTNWLLAVETTLTINAHATIDASYNYGVLMTPSRDGGGDTLDYIVDAVASGTAAKVTGR